MSAAAAFAVAVVLVAAIRCAAARLACEAGCTNMRTKATKPIAAMDRTWLSVWTAAGTLDIPLFLSNINDALPRA
jgi:hypothetical protein